MRRVIKRITLVLAALVVLSLGFVVIAIHTDWGRDIARRQVENVLADTFVGGGHIGKLEGSPFGELVARDVVLDGPDGKPAFSVGTLRVKLRLLPLLHHQATIDELVAEDVTAIIARDASGRLEVATLLKPGPKSKWKVDLRAVSFVRARVTYDAGGELVHADDVTVTASATIDPGGPIDAAATVTGMLRERAAPFAMTSRVHVEDGTVALPYVVARVGDAAASASSVTLGHGSYAGGIAITAPAKMIGELIPGVELPGDVVVSVRAVPTAHSLRIAATAVVGTAPIRALLVADLEGKRVAGVIGADHIDAGAFTHGAVTGVGSAVAIVDVTAGSDGELPTAHAMIHANGAFAGLADTTVVARIATKGHVATAIADIAGAGLKLHVDSEIQRAGSTLRLVHGRVVGSVHDLPRTSGGRIKARGTIDVDLTASGALVPAMDLAVTGRVDGAHLAIPGTSAGAVHASIDAHSLPAHPRGCAHVEIDDLVRGDTRLGQLTVDAANRSDGAIAVTVRSKPQFAPLAIDADAVVTLGPTVTVALERHHVRAYGNDWTGAGGTLSLGRDAIEMRDVSSSAGDQRLTVAGTYHRATGDFTADASLKGFSLAAIHEAYRGHADAQVSVSRTHGKWSGDAKLAVKSTALHPELIIRKQSLINVDGDVEIHLRDRALQLASNVSSGALGSVKLKLDVTAPVSVADVAAWQHLGRDAVRDLEVELHHIDLDGVSRLYQLAPMQGHVDANLAITPAAVKGTISLDHVVANALRASGPVSTNVTIAQTGPNELSPTGRIQLGTAGTITLDAKLGIPEHLFDPGAWGSLGRDILHSASVRSSTIALDQGLLARFGIVTEIHGELGVSVDVDRGGRTVRAMIDVRHAHGGPITKPIDVHIDAVADAETTTARLTIRRKDLTIVTGTAKLGVPLDAIRGSTPLVATIELPSVSAPDLLGVFGRTDIIKGSLDGNIAIAGTVLHPTVTAKVAVKDIAIQPTSRTKTVQALTKLDLAASWDGTTAKITIDGTESGGGKLHAVAAGSPGKLAAATATIEATNLDLQPLAVFAPDPGSAISGKLDGKLAITGFVPATAKLAGKLKVSNARIPLAPTVGTLHKATLDIGIDEHKLDIAIDGKLGGGTVTAKGSALLDKGDVSGAEIKMQLRGISPIGSIEPKINADVTTKVSHGGDHWKVDVVVDHANVYVPPDRGEKLAEVGEPADMRFVENQTKTRATSRRPTHTSLEVDITLHDTDLESEELRAIIRGKLAISIGDGVGFVGDIEADRGDVDLFGQRYTVDRAAIHFDGSPDPLLDIAVTHDFADVTTTTVVQGRLSAPKLVMSSEPAVYSQGQLLGFLLGGEPNGDPESGSARQTATDAGASLVGSKLTGYMHKALPVSVDVLRYESATASSSAAVLVGTWLTRTLFLAYREHLDALPDENTGEGTLEYWLSRRLVLEGTVGDRNVDGIDLLWRRRW